MCARLPQRQPRRSEDGPLPRGAGAQDRVGKRLARIRPGTVVIVAQADQVLDAFRHAAELVAVHGHPDEEVTEKLPVPPLAATDWLVGDNVYVHGAAD